jgi:hypothetical protein
MSKMAVVEIWKQLATIEVIQLLSVIIPTIGVETVVAPNTNFVKGGILMGFAMNLGCGLRGVLTKRNLTTNSRIPIITIRVVGTP